MGFAEEWRQCCGDYREDIDWTRTRYGKFGQSFVVLR